MLKRSQLIQGCGNGGVLYSLDNRCIIIAIEFISGNPIAPPVDEGSKPLENQRVVQTAVQDDDADIEGVEPVLDYEQEEEQVLAALEAPLEANRATVHVAEDGSVGALERRLRAAEYDVVHLSGHGLMTPEGPRLVMEDDLGARDDVSPEVLFAR